jgi:hypothetical protein
MKSFFSEVPVWYLILVFVFFLFGCSLFVYSVSKCGIGTTLLLGNGAPWAAYMGFCESN